MKSDDVIDINQKDLYRSVKSFSPEQLKSLSDAMRKEIILQAAANGSHLSSNLGSVELTISLCRVFDFPDDKLIFDVGHQSYAYKMLTGRSLKNIGLKGATGFFQSRGESRFDIYDAGHSSTSVSAAMGFAAARDMHGEKFDVISVIGDASLANGMAMEALNGLACFPHKVILVINDNDMSISPAVGGLNRHLNDLTSGKLPSEESLFAKLGLSYIGPIDGHDIEKLDQAFEKAKNSPVSAIVHVKTIKGKGYPPAERDRVGTYHGPEPFDPATDTPLDRHEHEISWAKFMADYSLKMMETHPESMFLVSGTLLGSSLSGVEAKYKPLGRFIDVGIGEEHAMSMAGAMALGGIHPILEFYGCFLQRAYDQISHDCARLGANMTLLIDRAGLNGRHGETHQGIYDVAFLNSIPNVIITMPSNEIEARALYRESFRNHGVFAIRFPKAFMPLPLKEDEVDLPFGRFSFLREGSGRCAIIAPGPVIRKLEKALKDDVAVINPIYLNHFDTKDLDKLCFYEKIFIYDPTGVQDGFSSIMAASLLENGYKGEIRIKAIPDTFVKHASVEDQLKDLGLDLATVVESANAFFYGE